VAIKFARSFLGYSPKAVEKTIDSIHAECEKQLRELEEQYAQEEFDLQSLKKEIKGQKDSVESFRVLDEELSKMLVSAHLGACGKIMDAINLAGQLEEGALNKVLECENQSARLKKTMDDLLKEIQTITKRYRFALEGSDDE